MPQMGGKRKKKLRKTSQAKCPLQECSCNSSLNYQLTVTEQFPKGRNTSLILWKTKI